ncbi:MAG: P1 family peptidase [Nitrospinota bacterium]
MEDPELKGSIADVEGIRVGHAQDPEAKTGLTVILCDRGTQGAVDLRGSASATRGLDPFRSEHLVGEVNALLFAGGSAFGLDAAAGAMAYLEERWEGFPVGKTVVPTVGAAIVFDLNFGEWRVRPDPAMARRACEAASGEEGPQGSVGAGTGATVGKLLGIEQAMKGGLGTASLRSPSGTVVGALAVVNALGDILDRRSGEILAGCRKGRESRELADSTSLLRAGVSRARFGQNTTLVAVATDARLPRSQLHGLAQMAASGVVRAIRPAFTTFDGDAIFSLCRGERKEDLNVLGALAEEAVARAINRAVREADGFGLLPAWRDLARP